MAASMKMAVFWVAEISEVLPACIIMLIALMIQEASTSKVSLNFPYYTVQQLRRQLSEGGCSHILGRW
jgi:hypothetical protein